MAKTTRPIDLALRPRLDGAPIQQWLYEEIRRAILDARIRRGDRLPSTRSLAAQQGVSRGSVVTVFEQLEAEGYITSSVGSGARVSERIPDDLLQARASRPATPQPRPTKETTLFDVHPILPFRPDQPAVEEFPVETWTRLAARRLRRLSTAALASENVQGAQPLRKTIADYLGASRGVRCHPDQIAVTSGIQQSLDLVARLLLRPGDRAWIEDPGYFGAVSTFRRAGAQVVAVPVDQHGIQVADGVAQAPHAKAVYVTPGHQFGLGVVMSVDRRLELLEWAARARAFIIEDDYDSEYRFSGNPVAALQGLDEAGRVIYLGTFNKTLFASLRLGYIVLPNELVDPYLELRFDVDRSPPSMSQAILTDFIAEGHFGRHLRRMRELYASRLEALRQAVNAELAGAIELLPIQAGLCTTGILRNGMPSAEAEQRAANHRIVASGIHNFTIERTDVQGVMLGFAAFPEEQIHRATRALAKALS